MIANETFAGVQPSFSISRSKHVMPFGLSTSFKAGELVPFLLDGLAMPTQTTSVKASFVIRSATPVAPVMDDLFIDFAFFFVPNRLVYSRESMSPDLNSENESWKAIIGAQDSYLNMPVPEQGVRFPTLSHKTAVHGGIWDTLGEGDSTETFNVNCLPILAYYSVWNEFYRDPNLMKPVVFSRSPDPVENIINLGKNEDAGIDKLTGSVDELKLATVCSFHSYFGSALPWPQREISALPLITDYEMSGVLQTTGEPIPLNGSLDVGFPGGNKGIGGPVWAEAGDTTEGNIGVYLNDTQPSPVGEFKRVNAINLVPVMTGKALGTINNLRLNFATQRWYEALARSGNRYSDMMSGIFGDKGGLPLDRPTLLSVVRRRLDMSQVAATADSGTGDNLPLGATGAFSLTSGEIGFSPANFHEHGTIVGVLCVRPNDTISQGISRQYGFKTREDLYFPQFAHIGEMGIYNWELCALGTKAQREKFFGYTEAWNWHRMRGKRVGGELRPGRSLGYWTYADEFKSCPDLKEFVSGRRYQDNVDRTLRVGSKTSGFQFIIDIAGEETSILPMPLHSVPGLIDHY